MEPLLDSTPLLSVQARTHLLVNNMTTVSVKPWNTQQVCAEAVLSPSHPVTFMNVQSGIQQKDISLSILRLKPYSKS